VRPVPRRAQAPCILFIDEFDGLGKARQYGGAGNDEAVHTINQLLTEMDGFDDNTGVVVMAATNRPAALDQALTRPGRFDRIVHLPLPNVEGRVGILRVHSRDKRVDPELDFAKVARATAGFTGAELMNLMNQAAILAARQGQPCIAEAEVFEALEKVHREKMAGGASAVNFEQDVIPPAMRRTIALYEAARALVGHLTPGYDEIQRVSVCPGGLATGYTYFLPQ
jgi:cell division protease FtsH